jgi:hypothetical protein
MTLSSAEMSRLCRRNRREDRKAKKCGFCSAHAARGGAPGFARHPYHDIP